MKKTVITILLSVIAIAVGIGLPFAVFRVQDSKLGSSFDEVIDDALNDNNVQTAKLSISDKLNIMASPETSFLGIGSGKNLSEDEVRECAADFAERLSGLYINTQDIPHVIEDSYVVATLVTEEKGAGRSFISWNVTVTLEDSIIGFDVDDESGKVLKFTRITNSAVGIPGDDSDVAATVAFVGQMLGEYYGIEYIGIDYPHENDPGRWFIRLGEGEDRVLIQLLYDPYGTTIGEGYYYDKTIDDDAEIIVY